MPRFITQRVPRLVVLLLLALLALPVMAGAAQDATDVPATESAATEVPVTEEPAEEPAYSWIKVAGLLCLDRSCLEFGDRIDGLTITAIDIQTRESFGSCVTDFSSETQGCELEVPANSQWTLIYDESQTPEGYEYKGSIIGVEGGAHGSITYVPFIPLADDDAAAPPVAQLPTTGGAEPRMHDNGQWEAIALAFVTLALSGTALHLRRR